MANEAPHELFKRVMQEEDNRRQAAAIVLNQIGVTDRTLRNAIRQAQRHPLANASLKFLELAAQALDSAMITAREEMGDGE